MPSKPSKSRYSQKVIPQRLTFTFSNTPELNIVVQSLEDRLSGLNRAEIVKLALIEYNNFLKKQDEFYEKALRLSDEEEKSLIKAMKSESVLVDTEKEGELEKALDLAKKKYV